MSARTVGDLRSAEAKVYSTAVCLASYAYHFVWTIPSEVQMIWSAPWTYMKISYLANRYLGLFVVVMMSVGMIDNPLLCTLFLRAVGYLALILVMIVEVILQIRLHALYGHKRSLVVVVTVAYLMTIASTIALAVLTRMGVGIHEMKSDVKDSGTCSLGLDFPLLPTFVFDACIVAVLTYKVIQHARFRSRMHVPAYWGHGGRILAILTRDSAWYYICVLVTMSLRGLGSTLSPPIEENMSIVWAFAVPTVSATSMILNVRVASANAKEQLWQDTEVKHGDVVELNVINSPFREHFNASAIKHSLEAGDAI